MERSRGSAITKTVIIMEDGCHSNVINFETLLARVSLFL